MTDEVTLNLPLDVAYAVFTVLGATSGSDTKSESLYEMLFDVFSEIEGYDEYPDSDLYEVDADEENGVFAFNTEGLNDVD